MSTTPGMESAPECSSNAQPHSTGEFRFSYFCQVSNEESILIRDGTLHPLIFYSWGLSDLNLRRSCVCSHSLWVQMYICPAVPGRHCILGVVPQKSIIFCVLNFINHMWMRPHLVKSWSRDWDEEGVVAVCTLTADLSTQLKWSKI